jgi:hypothetical protein
MMLTYEVVKSLEGHVVAVHPNTSQQRCIKNACSFDQIQSILSGPIAMHMNFDLK